MSNLRSITLGAKKDFAKENVEANGGVFEIRQPTLAQRGKINKEAMTLKFTNDDEGESVDFDMFAFLICAVVELTYDPKTGEKVFTEEDYDTIKSLPSGGWFDKLSKVASKLCNVKDEDVKKPSGSTKAE